MEQDGLFARDVEGQGRPKKFYKAFTTAFPDAKFEVQKTVGVGDYAIVESIPLKGTHKGALGSIQPTKKPIAIHIVDVMKIKDGKIAKASTYQNSLELQMQPGLFNLPDNHSVPSSQAAPPKPAATLPRRPRPLRRAAETPAAAPAAARTPAAAAAQRAPAAGTAAAAAK